MSVDLTPGFDGALLKVKRAYRHIDEFKNTIDEIGHLNTKGLVSSHNPEHGHLLTFADFGETGLALPLIIGDAIHNLRAALDHLWMALWRASDKGGFGTFPFHETRKNLEDAVAKSPVKVAFPDVERLILDSVKPYGDLDGNRTLWTITKFDKLDKHNLIIPILNTHHVFSGTIHLPGGGSVYIGHGSFTAMKTFISSDEPVEFESNDKITVEATFPNGDLLGGEPILPALVNMAEATGKAVQLFRETFLK